MQTRPAGQLGGKGEAGPHPPAVGDHREGAPSRAPSICKEPAGFGRQSFPLHSACSSPSVAQRGSQELAFYSCGPSKSLPGGSTQTEAVLEPLVRPNCLSLAMQDPKPPPQVVIKKKKKSEKAKVTNEGLEGFVDWTNSTISQSVKEKEAECLASSLDFLYECASELPTLKRGPHSASRFWLTSVLGRLDLMRGSKLL